MPPITLHTNGLWPCSSSQGWKWSEMRTDEEAGGLGELRLVDERTGPVVLAGEEVAEGRHDGRAGRQPGSEASEKRRIRALYPAAPIQSRSSSSMVVRPCPSFLEHPSLSAPPACATGLTHRIQAVTVDDDDAVLVGATQSPAPPSCPGHRSVRPFDRGSPSALLAARDPADQAGNRRAAMPAPSRTQASMTRPATPRARAATVSTSPHHPCSGSPSTTATSTSPAVAAATAWWISRLSPCAADGTCRSGRPGAGPDGREPGTKWPGTGLAEGRRAEGDQISDQAHGRPGRAPSCASRFSCDQRVAGPDPLDHLGPPLVVGAGLEAEGDPAVAAEAVAGRLRGGVGGHHRLGLIPAELHGEARRVSSQNTKFLFRTRNGGGRPTPPRRPARPRAARPPAPRAGPCSTCPLASGSLLRPSSGRRAAGRTR